MLVVSVGRLVIAVACGVASERRIMASCQEGGGGAAGVPGKLHSLFGIFSNTNSITLPITFLPLFGSYLEVIWNRRSME
jgi:hypothetical protein